MRPQQCILINVSSTLYSNNAFSAMYSHQCVLNNVSSTMRPQQRILNNASSTIYSQKCVDNKLFLMYLLDVRP